MLEVAYVEHWQRQPDVAEMTRALNVILVAGAAEHYFGSRAQPHIIGPALVWLISAFSI